MLLELKAANIGVIKEIHWKLSGGLNVITGETGAGKSLVIDAVELLLAGKFHDDVIRHGEAEARIEGIFTLPAGDDDSLLGTLLEQSGISTDDEDILVISCQIRRKSPGIVRVNGQTVTKTVLRRIGQSLVDIHGQSEHLSLLNVKTHLDFLDSYAGATELRHEFSDLASRLHKAEEELEALKSLESERLNRDELRLFQIGEIADADLREGEEEELEHEKELIASAERLKELSHEVYRILYESDGSGRSTAALDKLNEALGALRKLADLDNEHKKAADFLDEVIYGLTEISRDVRAYGEGIEYDPARLEEIESRLELIRKLKRKYGATVTEVLIYLEKAREELDATGISAEKRSRLEKESAGLRKEMGRLASRLSSIRSEAANHLVTDVKQELKGLNMAQVEFNVAVTRDPDHTGIPLPDGETYTFNSYGVDNVEFMAATNPGESLKPLVKIASTGELSRFTLALKVVLSGNYGVPVVIFDEIDIGIGGRSGEIIGRKLWKLSRNSQVICVTHLPQIAAYADAHFGIHKEILNARTSSILEELDHDSRINELAVMLSGPQYTETALKNARELVLKAGTWKQSQENS